MASTPHPTSQLLILGVAQAVLFVAGGLLGRWIGMALGVDAFASTGYSAREMIGILLVGLGAGGGLQLARVWYTRRYGNPRG
ncbi:MAG: hypothetical protein JWQ73_1649 [Variovorax sp.]|nr:hypothetical protein [Variovorax sp.]